MRETYWGYWLVLLGVFVIGVMLLVNNISTTNTQDYYNIKEVTQASMIDAVDFSYYRLYGNIKMSEQKFVENFMRRFVENVNMANTYDIGFYDLSEVPPKVSVKISTGSRSFNIANSRNDYDVVTTLNAVLELGVQGEDSEGEGKGTKKKETSCGMYLTSDLMRYFKGQLNGYSLANDGVPGYTFDSNSKEFKSIKDLDGFRKWFNANFKPNGSTPAKQYLQSKSYDELPEYMKLWHQRGWITIR